jgi:hypothetical protein
MPRDPSARQAGGAQNVGQLEELTIIGKRSEVVCMLFVSLGAPHFDFPLHGFIPFLLQRGKAFF